MTPEGPFIIQNLVPNGSAALSNVLMVGDLVYGGTDLMRVIGLFVWEVCVWR